MNTTQKVLAVIARADRETAYKLHLVEEVTLEEVAEWLRDERRGEK